MLNKFIEVELLNEIAWFYMADADILHILNPYEQTSFIAANMAKDYGLKLWIDLDDDVLNVPPNHPESEKFCNYNFKQIIWKLMEMADAVSVPTESIKNSLMNYNKNIHVIPNAFNDYNCKLSEMRSNKQIISWRGSKTHKDDLKTVKKALVELSEKYPHVVFNFLGDPDGHYHVTDDMPNRNIMKAIATLDYFKYMSFLAPGIQIHPLEDNEFNRGKSNIAWIEGAAAGAVCVMPKLPEFEKPGCLTYSTDIDFTAIIQDIISNSGKYDGCFFESKKYIEENLMLSEVNKLRLNLIEGL